MRPRASGGLEPDESEQARLVKLWHLSRTALAGSPTRSLRLQWVVDTFVDTWEYDKPARKWVYVWCERYLGRLVDPDPVPMPDWLSDGPTTSDASSVPTKRRSKKRAK